MRELTDPRPLCHEFRALSLLSFQPSWRHVDVWTGTDRSPFVPDRRMAGLLAATHACYVRQRAATMAETIAKTRPEIRDTLAGGEWPVAPSPRTQPPLSVLRASAKLTWPPCSFSTTRSLYRCKQWFFYDHLAVGEPYAEDPRTPSLKKKEEVEADITLYHKERRRAWVRVSTGDLNSVGYF